MNATEVYIDRSPRKQYAAGRPKGGDRLWPSPEIACSTCGRPTAVETGSERDKREIRVLNRIPRRGPPASGPMTVKGAM